MKLNIALFLLLLLSSCNTTDDDTEFLDLVSIRNWYKFEERDIDYNSPSVRVWNRDYELRMLGLFDTIPNFQNPPRHSPRKHGLGSVIQIDEDKDIILTEEFVDTLESKAPLMVKYTNDTIFANHNFDYLALHFKRTSNGPLQWNLKSERKGFNYYVKVENPSVFCKLEDLEAIFIVTDDTWNSVFDSRYEFACLYNVNDSLYLQKYMNSHLRDVLLKAGF